VSNPGFSDVTLTAPDGVVYGEKEISEMRF